MQPLTECLPSTAAQRAHARALVRLGQAVLQTVVPFAVAAVPHDNRTPNLTRVKFANHLLMPALRVEKLVRRIQLFLCWLPFLLLLLIFSLLI